MHEEEELLAMDPSTSLVIATHPDSQMVVREGQVGGMVVVEENVDPPPLPPNSCDGTW